ncbi:MAG: hypothetical protein ACREGR_03835, partial [Minisyncoccia bacterium]
ILQKIMSGHPEGEMHIPIVNKYQAPKIILPEDMPSIIPGEAPKLILPPGYRQEQSLFPPTGGSMFIEGGDPSDPDSQAQSITLLVMKMPQMPSEDDEPEED